MPLPTRTKSGGEFKSPPDSTILDQNIPTLALQNALDFLVLTQNLPLKIKIEIHEKHLEITCDNQPKTIAFDTPDNDWQHFENHGASQKTESGKLLISIPFTSNAQRK